MKYLKVYGVFGLFRLTWDKIFTILFFPDFRILRTPYYIRGKQFIQGGKGLTTGVGLRIDLIETSGRKPKLIIGNHVQFNDYVHIGVVDEVIIGDNTLIASKVFISDHNHGAYSGEDQSSPGEPPIFRKLVSKKVIIGANVWIGEYVSILPGVTIGDGAVIGTMSVVAKDIPANSIAVGAPAKVIKTYKPDEKKWSY